MFLEVRGSPFLEEVHLPYRSIPMRWFFSWCANICLLVVSPSFHMKNTSGKPCGNSCVFSPPNWASLALPTLILYPSLPGPSPSFGVVLLLSLTRHTECPGKGTEKAQEALGKHHCLTRHGDRSKRKKSVTVVGKEYENSIP